MLEDIVVRMDLDLHNLQQMRNEQRALQLQLEKASRRREDRAPSEDKDAARQDQDRGSDGPEGAAPSSDGKLHVVDMILE